MKVKLFEELGFCTIFLLLFDAQAAM